MLPSNNITRRFSETHLSEDCRLFSNLEVSNGLFFDCDFENISKATLKNCDLNRSRIKPKTFRDMLDVTLTLNCHTFNEVELNELAFDAILALLISTKGNDLKRAKLVDVIGRSRYNKIKKIMGESE